MDEKSEKYIYKDIYINIPNALCMENIFDKGLTPIFYIVYIYIASRLCPICNITFTIGGILSECRSKLPRNHDGSFADTVKAIEYLYDTGYIYLSDSLGDDITYDTPINIGLNREAFTPAKRYTRLKYNDYYRILARSKKVGHVKPEYSVMIYLYIISHIISRPDNPRMAFFEKRYNTCKKLGISTYRYDTCTDFLDECHVLIKWRSVTRRNYTGVVRTIPNIYTYWREDAHKYYIESLKEMLGIDDIDKIEPLIQLDKKRLEQLKTSK